MRRSSQRSRKVRFTISARQLVLCPLVLAVACAPGARERVAPERGTVGEEVYGIFCDRIGAQALTEDLDGSSFHSICHKNADGQYADVVDEALLPPIDSNVTSTDGGPVNLDELREKRKRRMGRLMAVVRRRQDIIRALDAAFPDVVLPTVVDIHNDPAKSCTPVDAATAGRDARFTRQLADMLGRLQALYNDGTLPRTTRALGRIMQDLEASPEGRTALARSGARVGYRPPAVQLGLVRPAIAYGRLRDLSNASLSLLSADSQPYAFAPPRAPDGTRIPVAGPAHPAFAKLLETVHEELRTYTPDPVPPPLALLPDPVLGANVLSRPRTRLEAIGTLAYATDPAFASPNAKPLFVVARDGRGYAVPRRTTPGVVPAPFVDDGSGQPKVDDLGRFVTTTGKLPPSPLDVPAAPDLIDLPVVKRDDFGRALGDDGQLVYDYVDASATFSNALLDNLRPLIHVDTANPSKSDDTLMDAVAGLEILLGHRDGEPKTTRTYAPDPKRGNAPVVVSYDAFHAEDARLADFVHAISNVLSYHDADATLALVRKVGVEHEGDLARLIGEALRLKAVSDANPNAVLPRTSTFWDDLLDVVIAIAKEPGMLEEILKVLGNDTFVQNGQLFANYMQYRDRLSYDRDNLNGPVFNKTTNKAGDDPKSPVDRTKPDAGDNRSELQRFVQLVHDTNGVTACNKDNGLLYVVLPNVVLGQPAGVLFPADFTYAPSGAGTGGYKACEFLKVDNLAKFYLESIFGKSKLVLRQSDVKAGTASRAFLNPKNPDPATQKEGDWCGFDVAPASLVGGLCLPTQQCCLFPNVVNFSQAASESLFETVTGIKGFWTTNKTFALKPEFLSRFAFFDFDGDTKNLVTKTSLLRVNGKNIGTRACKEKVFRDPCAPGSGAPHQPLCASAPDIAADGMVHGYYECESEADTLRARNDDTLFLGEVFGFQEKIKPLLGIFVARDKTQLFIDLMEVLHTHYQTAAGAGAGGTCAPTGGRTTDGKYCARSGVSSYEPILADMFVGDLLSGLHDLEKTLAGITVKRCTAFAPATKLCTTAADVPAIDLLASTTRDLVDPAHAATNGLKNRDGSVAGKRADGTPKAQVTSIDQIANALTSFDDAFDAYAKDHPEDAGRKAQWRRARSRLVDVFLAASGAGKDAKFKNRVTPAILPILVDVLRQQLDARCPGAKAPPYPACAWATDLAKSLTEVTSGPTFASALDVLDAVRKDDRARTETELFLLYLLDPAAPNDARASLLTMLVDLLQVLRDDDTLAPILHAFAGAARPDTSVRDAGGKVVQSSVVDASTALLARLSGRAFDAEGREICAREIDPNQILTLSLQNLVKPFPADPAAPNRPTQTPLELLLDVIAEVNRADPGLTSKMIPNDYGSVAANVESFLLDKQRGLEQFYEVIRLGTQGQER
jgi:hypothetical protein